LPAVLVLYLVPGNCRHNTYLFDSIFTLFSPLIAYICNEINIYGMIRIYSLFLSVLMLNVASAQTTTYEGTQLTPKGAWCWFADPRALHHKNDAGTINSSYIGYIDVHGNIKASQINFLTGKTQEVLIRSYFQPDDHNNPTFLILPDDRVMIFYSRHTDEACFYYRISQQPGDITTLGPEIRLATSHNTTYPSPFILSDDPTGIYLAWRGINWHPTIARLSMPDSVDRVQFTWGPHQLVQSTAARPYAKYTSNGKDKIFMTYTTGHPDNENPNYVYFNAIDIKTKQLQDIKGKTLSTIGNAIHNVSATSAYFNANPDAVVENASYRNWVWQTTIDAVGRPVIALVRISADKLSHHYYYARWNGTSWQRTFVADGGGKFHQTSGLELCYSGGMAIDDTNPSLLYCSQPVAGLYGTRYEIVKYQIDEDGKVAGSEAITRNSRLNNSRPYIVQNAGTSPLKLSWMNGNYYDWIVSSSRPQGYPTAIHIDYQLPEQVTDTTRGLVSRELFNEPITASGALVSKKVRSAKLPATSSAEVKNGVLVSSPQLSSAILYEIPLSEFTVSLSPALYEGAYSGVLLKINDIVIGLDAQTLKPYVKKGSQQWNSSNVLGTSDVWQTQSRGTSGAWYTPTKLKFFNLTLTYADGWLTTFRDGLIDQKIEIPSLMLTSLTLGGFTGWIEDLRVYNRALLQEEIKQLTAVSTAYVLNPALLTGIELNQLNIPATVTTDIVLPSKSSSGSTISWASTNTTVLPVSGLVNFPAEPTVVTLTATLNSESKVFDVMVMPRDISANRLIDYRFEASDVFTEGSQRMIRDASGNENHAQVMGNAQVDGSLNLTSNSAAAFSTNGYVLAPSGILSSLRSASFLLKVNASALTKQPRLFDFGSGSGNSVFLRGSAFSAGYKYNGAATTLINSSTQLPLNQELKVAMTYDARSKTTRVYLNGQAVVSGTSIVYEPWQLTAIAPDLRNYIGRTQWWDSSVAADNIDFQGTIDDFMLYDIALTAEEIIQIQEQPNRVQPVAGEPKFENPVQVNQPFTIQVPDEASTLQLYTAGGKLLASFHASATVFELPGIALQGVYFLRLINATHTASYKLMVI
jgi:hypothetical protein